MTDEERARELEAARASLEPYSRQHHRLVAHARAAEWIRRVRFLFSELDRVTAERDEAIAHDRQPYPTAQAYERACAAAHKREAELDAALADVKRLREALNAVAEHESGEAGDALCLVSALNALADTEPKP